MFVIITDGQENASREYSGERIKALIEHQKEKFGWEFIFLGANIDAVEAAGRYGIKADRAQRYHADAQGTRLNFEAVSKAAAKFRKSAAMPEDWKDTIEKDYRQRGGE